MRQPSPVAKKRTSFNIAEATLKQFKEICIREGETESGKIEKFMTHYNQAHSNGNPQLRISVYAKPEEPSPMRVLCDFIRGATSEGQVNCRRKGSWFQGIACYSCEKNQLRKNKPST